jgi:hypothetical protein
MNVKVRTVEEILGRSHPYNLNIKSCRPLPLSLLNNISALRISILLLRIQIQNIPKNLDPDFEAQNLFKFHLIFVSF